MEVPLNNVRRFRFTYFPFPDYTAAETTSQTTEAKTDKTKTAKTGAAKAEAAGNSSGKANRIFDPIPKQPYSTLSSSARSRKLVADLNFCSQKGLVDRFDSTIGAGTVLMPFGGIYQATPAQSMVAKLPVLKGDTKTCSAMSWSFNPFITESDPYLGSYLAVVESVAKLIASGGDLKNCWLSFQEYFEKLGDDPRRWGKPFAALLGS